MFLVHSQQGSIVLSGRYPLPALLSYMVSVIHIITLVGTSSSDSIPLSLCKKAADLRLNKEKKEEAQPVASGCDYTSLYLTTSFVVYPPVYVLEVVWKSSLLSLLFPNKDYIKLPASNAGLLGEFCYNFPKHSW